MINRVNSAKRRWDKEKQNSTEFLQMQIKVGYSNWIRDVVGGFDYHVKEIENENS